MNPIDLLGGDLFGLLAFIGLVIVIVGIHEGGHFSVAKAVGVRVLEFNIGFGKKLLWRTWGGTQYALRMLPLGGYVLMHGMARGTRLSWLTGSTPQDEPDEAEMAGAFARKSVWSRAAVIAAGPAANLVLAMVVIAIDVSVGDPAHIDSVSPGSPAAAVGMRAGDEITDIEGQSITYTSDIYRLVGSQHGGPVDVAVMRGGRRIEFAVIPNYDAALGRYLLGVHPSHARFAPAQAAQLGWSDTWDAFGGTLSGLWALVSGAIPGGVTGPQGLTGMVGVVGLTNQYAHEGPDAFAYWMAFFSVQLALINLFPLPVLDGGRLVLLGLEAVRRRPLDPQKELVVNYVGLMVILALAVVVNLNDVRRLVLPH
jgi:regulator of sigma E protease